MIDSPHPEALGARPRPCAVDTSWLFALLDRTDTHHAKARDEGTIPGDLLLNPIILVETLETVRHNHGRARSIEVSKAILVLPHLRLVESPKNAVMARVIEKHRRISWQDASAIATALDEGGGLRTFDAAQRTAFESMR